MAENKKPDGGPAFAVPGPGSQVGQPGMSLRDYLAGIVLQSCILIGKDKNTPKGVATISYNFADAMIKERDKK